MIVSNAIAVFRRSLVSKLPGDDSTAEFSRRSVSLQKQRSCHVKCLQEQETNRSTRLEDPAGTSHLIFP